MLRGKGIGARWEELVAESVIAGGVIVQSAGTVDYQGRESIFIRLDDGRWSHYEWSYGSCSGCDAWEDRAEAWGSNPGERDAVMAEINDAVMGCAMDCHHAADYLIANWESGWLCDSGEDYSYEARTGPDRLSLLESIQTECKALS